jgi:RND family efflux transporter MFP subunit
MKKWIVLLLLVGAGYFGYRKWPESKGKQAEPAITGRPTTAVVENRNIRFTVSAAGEIGPAEQVSVKPEINGRIETLPVDLGDVVKKGDVLFTLDDKELQNEKSSNLTEIERSKLQLAQASRNFSRAQQLYDGKLISLEIFENTKTEYELAKNTLEKTQKEGAILDERLTKTKIVAPFNCTILTRPVSMGQAVSGSGGFNSGTEVLTIADLNSMVINAHINQADISRLKVDLEVEVQVEAVAGLKVMGKVERIAPQATIKNNIKGFAVRILLKDVDQRIRPGMTANVKIPVASADNVKAVPLAAVFTEKNPETGMPERYLYVTKDDGYEKRPVQIGVADFFFVEIQSGLEAGEIVALEQPKEERERIAKQSAKSLIGGFMRPSSPAGSLGSSQVPSTSERARPSEKGSPKPNGASGKTNKST